jgi:hypothetical protein
VNGRVAAKRQSHASPKADFGRDPLYLFACHVEWRSNRNLRAFQELLAALEEPNEGVRLIAESLLGGLSR